MADSLTVASFRQKAVGGRETCGPYGGCNDSQSSQSIAWSTNARPDTLGESQSQPSRGRTHLCLTRWLPVGSRRQEDPVARYVYASIGR